MSDSRRENWNWSWTTRSMNCNLSHKAYYYLMAPTRGEQEIKIFPLNGININGHIHNVAKATKRKQTVHSFNVDSVHWAGEERRLEKYHRNLDCDDIFRVDICHMKVSRMYLTIRMVVRNTTVSHIIYWRQ